MLGADHASTLTTRTNLASVMAAQGKTAEAETELRQVLAAQQRELGADHPSTITTRQMLSIVLAAQGKTHGV
jgi:hypothetical protein